MTNPQRFINRVILFLVLASIVVIVVHDIVWRSFMHNPALNGLILGVLLLGIIYAVRRILLLKPEVRWIEAFRSSGPGFSLEAPPRLLAPVASALGEQERRGRASLSAMSMRYLLDSASARLDESRDITRYQTGLLIFLGLLGTFWGLLETINSVAAVIGGLSLDGDDMVGTFDNLKTGLAAPLSGMGTAFSSSLFGLAGSLVLGFIDLQATQAQNSFYNDMEEWLSTLTRHSSGDEVQPGAALPASQPLPAYLGAMLQQTAENVDGLRQSIERAEEGRAQFNHVLIGLNERLALMTEQMQRESEAIQQLAELQMAGSKGARGELAHLGALDEATREHIRNTDVKLGRVLDELVRGREESTRELRNEIRLVSRTIAIAAGDPSVAQQQPYGN